MFAINEYLGGSCGAICTNLLIFYKQDAPTEQNWIKRGPNVSRRGVFKSWFIDASG